MFKKVNSFFQYLFGFSFLGIRTVHGISKSGMKFLYNKLVVVLPFLSQADLLGWSKNLTNGMETIYDKAMDAEYIKTHIGGAYHRLFDGGHSPINAWEKVKNASDTDILSQEVIGYATALWKDATTKMGMPFTTIDKAQFDKAAEAISNLTGIKKEWLVDVASYDVFEILSTSLGVLGAIFFLKKSDKKKLSEILGAMGILSILSANVFMGVTVITLTAYAYFVKKNKLDKKSFIKGAASSTITYAIFSILGLPILIELIIFIVVLKLVKSREVPGKEFINMIINKLKVATPNPA